MKPIVLKKWKEVEATMLEDKSTLRYECFLFVQNCERHKGPKTGKITEHRRRTLVTIEGKSKKEAYRKVAAFVEKPDVVMLAEERA